MKEETQNTLVDLLLSTHQLLEKPEVAEALASPEQLAITKGVVARLVILLSNVQPEGK